MSNDTLSRLVGSTKQKVWASAIIRGLQDKHPGIQLPEVKDSSWWIKHRDEPIDNIIKASATGVKNRNSFFTRDYPSHGRSDAIEEIQTMGADWVMLDIETTGLERWKDEIIEIAIVHYGTGEVLLDTLLKPCQVPVCIDTTRGQ